ncbi:PaaI family thioesterase [Pelagibius sp.]|uniref:PaaI family thioesterase n=1 Tax=Pelagibius sp. TaxID=1931238 RepID=UPI00262EDBAB|nr:PaaI family thioesterase [Pelagibius sp.]
MNDWTQTQPALVPLDTVRKLSGLALLQGMMQGDYPPPPMAETLDFHLHEVAPGRVVFQGRLAGRFYNPLGTVHGGYSATLLDSAMACAVHSTLEPGEIYTTMEFKVQLVRALTEEVGSVLATGKVLHRGRRSATAEANLTSEDGKLFAHGTTTCMIMPITQ